MTLLNVPPSRNAYLVKDEIIVVRSGAYTADSAIVPQEYEGAVAGYDMVVTVRAALPHFMAAALLSKYVLADQLFQVRLRAAQPHLNAEELGSTLIVLPPTVPEQEAIVQHLNSATAEIHLAVSRTQTEINLIREYRTRLIADVVTGKIDVRGSAFPVSEAAAEWETIEEEIEPDDEADADGSDEEQPKSGDREDD